MTPIAGAKEILAAVCDKCSGSSCLLCQLHEFDRALELFLVDGMIPTEAVDKAHTEVGAAVLAANGKYDRNYDFVTA
jgi:hypothetical protein